MADCIFQNGTRTPPIPHSLLQGDPPPPHLCMRVGSWLLWPIEQVATVLWRQPPRAKWNYPETVTLREAYATWRWPGTRDVKVRNGRGGEIEQGSLSQQTWEERSHLHRGSSAPDMSADGSWIRDKLLSGALIEFTVQKTPEQNKMAVLNS